MNALLTALQGRKTHLTSWLIILLVIGQWARLWIIPTEAYAGLLAMAFSFLRSGLARDTADAANGVIAATNPPPTLDELVPAPQASDWSAPQPPQSSARPSPVAAATLSTLLNAPASPASATAPPARAPVKASGLGAMLAALGVASAILCIAFGLAACSSLSTNVFRTEQAATQLAFGAYAGYTNALAKGLLRISAADSNNIRALRLKFAASVSLVDSLNAQYATNSAIQSQLTAALATLGDQASNIVWTIGYVSAAATNAPAARPPATNSTPAAASPAAHSAPGFPGTGIENPAAGRAQSGWHNVPLGMDTTIIPGLSVASERLEEVIWLQGYRNLGMPLRLAEQY
jgi:hypothetical protein